jgi:tetratricopeptide (TPR) repeat protein
MPAPLLKPQPGPEPAFLSSRLAVILSGLVLALAALAIYANSFAGPFIFDDLPSIVENPTLRHLWPPGEVLATPHGAGQTVTGRPVLNLSLALNYALGGESVAGYHAVNLAIHVAAGLLLLGLVRRTLLLPLWQGRFASMALPLALSVALLWAVHPLQTESVTYVVQRAESLMGLWYLLTLYAFLRGATSPASGGGWFTLATVACLLGMGTKEVMVTAPLLVLLYDRTFVAGSFRGAWQSRGRWYLALAGTWILLAFLVAGTGGRGGSAGFGSGLSSWTYLLTQCRAVTLYLRLSVWPHPLVGDYGIERAETVAAVAPQALLLVLLAAATLVALWRRPVLGFLGCWFFVILAPTSSVIPVATQTIAEHRMYLPLAAVVALAVLAIYSLIGARSLAVFLLVALGLGAMTVQRNTVYHSAVSFWSDAAAQRPGNARARVALGTLLATANRLPEAAMELEAAVRLDPTRVEALNNLANVLAATGRFSEAIPIYGRVLELTPRETNPHYNLGNILAQLGRTGEALDQYQAAARLAPNDADVQYRVALTLAQLGRFTEAIGPCEQAVRLRPDFPEARQNLEAIRKLAAQQAPLLNR